MAKKLKKNSSLNGANATTARKRKTVMDKATRGAPTNDQDPKRRLGNFEGAGEAPRRGSRTSGIGGQTKQKFTTDKKQA